MKRILARIALAVIVLAFVSNLPLVRVLSVSNFRNPSEKLYSKSAVSHGFIISYTHSVNKGRVHDFYKIEKNGSLTVYKTVFVSYGAGIPESYETQGSRFQVTEDGYEISNLARTLPRFLMAVGVVAEHSIAPGKTFSRENERFLKSYFKPQTSLVFEVKRVSILGYIFARKI